MSRHEKCFTEFRRSRRRSFRSLCVIVVLVACGLLLRSYRSTSLLNDEDIRRHKSIIFNVSNPWVLANLIDQYLDTSDPGDRDELWPLLVDGWSASFQTYLQRTERRCSPSSSFDFVNSHLDQYTSAVIAANLEAQTHVTDFGLYFDYDYREVNAMTHQHAPRTSALSSCRYFDLIVLLMKIQLVLHELDVEYFIGSNALIGSIRHHDLIPWHTTVELNVPLFKRQEFLHGIGSRFQLTSQQVNRPYIDDKSLGLIYKIFARDRTWPHVEICFYNETAYEIFDSLGDGHRTFTTKSLLRKDVFPGHLRPFGPLLLFSMNNSRAVVSVDTLNTCENSPWDHQQETPTAANEQWRVPCVDLYGTYSFVQSKSHWRRGHCEDTLHTSNPPRRALSYFRRTC